MTLISELIDLTKFPWKYRIVCSKLIMLLLIWFHVIFILIAKNVLVSDPSLKWFACFVSISEQLTMFRSSLVRNSKGVCFNSETTIEEKVQEIDEDTWPFIFAAKSECTTYNMVSKLILEQSPIFRLKNWRKRPRKIWQILIWRGQKLTEKWARCFLGRQCSSREFLVGARISFIVSSKCFDIKAIKGLERVTYDVKEVGHGVKYSGFFCHWYFTWNQF